MWYGIVYLVFNFVKSAEDTLKHGDYLIFVLEYIDTYQGEDLKVISGVL